MESIQPPKLLAHCCRWRTRPLQKTSLFFSGFDLSRFKPFKPFSALTGQTIHNIKFIFTVEKYNQPVCQPKNEELNKGRFKKKLLILRAEVCESWDGLSPVSYNIQGTGQQVVELLDVAGILLFFQIVCLLLIL